MPLGSSKFVVNKNSTGGAPSPAIAPASFAITSTLSNDYLTSQGITNPPEIQLEPLQTITFDITSNRPNANVDFALVGNVVANDFVNTSTTTGTVTTDANGNATITKTVESDVSLNNNVDFSLQITRSGNASQILAQSNTFNIYNIEFPNISVTGANVSTTDVSLSNLIIDGRVFTVYEDANLIINSLGTLQSNAFQTLIGVNTLDVSVPENNIYRKRPLPIALVGAGGGGSTVDAGGGGAGGEVVYNQDSYTANLTATTYEIKVGVGGNVTHGVGSTPGGNSSVFSNTAIEISALGGGSGVGQQGGSIGSFAGGVGDTDFTYKAGGGGSNKMQFYSWFYNESKDSGIRGENGRNQRRGFTSIYDSFGGDGAGDFDSSQVPNIDQQTTNREWPFYDGIDPTGSVKLGMGGGGGTFNTLYNESRGVSGNNDPIFGKGGTTNFDATAGRPATGMGGGGSGDETQGGDGGSGIVYIRVPQGPNFRFISSTTY